MNLTDPIQLHFRLIDIQKKGLKKLGIHTIQDLLYYIPQRYGDAADFKNIADAEKNESISIYAKISKIELKKGFRSKIPMAKAMLEDLSGKIQAVWFHQPYIAKMIEEGGFAKFTGKITENKKGVRYLSNPEVEKIANAPETLGTSLFGKNTVDNDHIFYPVYSETSGVTSKWLYHALQKVFASGVLDTIVDPIPETILEKYKLPGIRTALIFVHSPKKIADAEAARKRFAFEEIFFIQLKKQQDRLKNEQNPAFIIEKTQTELEKFTSRFAFSLTDAQQKAVNDILNDFKRGTPMSRLLEGDVGSGKTAVAATTAYAAVTTRPKGQHFGTLQVAYMCPTEILAQQHFESFIQYFYHLGISIALITSSGCKKFPSKVNPTGWTDISRTQLLKWVKNGEIPILIGTHSLIAEKVAFKHLAYVIIDEQHRFGTAQRQRLARKSDNQDRVPHLLSMTATPIPRTLALTLYGDLDLTLVDSMPLGRKPIITDIIPPTKRDATYEKIRLELQAGRQAYVICPRIDEPDPEKEQALNTKSVKEEAKRLQKDVFPEYKIDVIHGKMSGANKEDIMEEFSSGTINILVATSLIEVGVNVPNATVIIIEGAERFGLSQLHQLRGRVIRSNHQAYCYIFSDTKNQKSMDRLHALKTASSGFELAEADLALRGSGELYGRKQWGISDLAMEALKNLKMVEAARKEARVILEQDISLSAYPLLKSSTENADNNLHFE